MAVKAKKGTKRQARPGLRRWFVGTVRNGKLLALLLVGLSGGLGYIALTSPRFTVQTIKAEGNRALTEADVTRFAQATGQSIWFVHPNDIRGRIAESPYVETVKVRLQLPDAVVVTIAERQPD
ncbi:MAG: FtsQ-type POTRA domain-containing protein, partial [Herpetosiphonaceae bacterium]|nr:FtsQ-type POTRA domain-containing protein [Herpetosiphonaceae bacterium]